MRITVQKARALIISLKNSSTPSDVFTAFLSAYVWYLCVPLHYARQIPPYIYTVKTYATHSLLYIYIFSNYKKMHIPGGSLYIIVKKGLAAYKSQRWSITVNGAGRGVFNKSVYTRTLHRTHITHARRFYDSPRHRTSLRFSYCIYNHNLYCHGPSRTTTTTTTTPRRASVSTYYAAEALSICWLLARTPCQFIIYKGYMTRGGGGQQNNNNKTLRFSFCLCKLVYTRIYRCDSHS